MHLSLRKKRWTEEKRVRMRWTISLSFIIIPVTNIVKIVRFNNNSFSSLNAALASN